MKTKLTSFWVITKSILGNEKGEVNVGDGGGESAPAPESSESPSESSEIVEASDGEVVEVEPESEVVENDESSIESSEESQEETTVQAETEQELEQEIQDAVEAGASEEEVQDMIRQYVIKVDGKEYTRELDLNNEDEIKRQLQLAYKGQQSMQELQELKKLYSQELENLLADPLERLKALDPNFDPLEASGKYIEKLMKEQEMTPEQKAEMAREKELKELREERDRLRQEAEQREQQAIMQKLADEIQEDIMSALSADPDLVADRDTVALVAGEMADAAEKNIDMSAKEALVQVKANLRKQFDKTTSMFKSNAALKQYVGNNLLDKLRIERVEQAKKQVKNLESIQNVSKKEAEKKPEKPKVNLNDILYGRD